ncbi:FGGY family carbohydrate kinase [Actinoplanes sp. TRM 88003]|uniref:ATP:glycerol 3-phosphotransferase n=1 Tax=Paractinoplanes aksuensis TaxID=2939490 RepID=A0ABT1DLB5_9ACTN|nr:FGGY family carbohydrate kinase [Actinoplanes aksuensis]MCO8270551.1 FGGY family carbohydrate kinase [Actinoplanes aksuensis]
MTGDLVLAIDQGTSSTKCLLVDAEGVVVATGSAPVPIRYPRPGWVEQDAGEILDSVLVAAAQCLADVPREWVRAVGFSTQRESALVWDKRTGEPAGPVLGWQDQRAQPICDALREKGQASRVREISGLPLDPMFSAAKLRWLLDRAPDAVVGTIDSWLLYALTGSHQIESGNASRTQLLDVRAGAWSPELLDLFGIPSTALPSLTPSAGELGRIGERGGELAGLPITAVLGDSHAALYAHGDRAAAGAPRGPASGGALGGPEEGGALGGPVHGGVKVTYGTGSSVMRLGAVANDGVCMTVAWNDELAAEGNIRSSGSTVAWLADLLGSTPEQIGRLAASASSDGVCLVPGFGGLAAPWWDDTAVGLISGLTLGTKPAQLARAAVESIAHQVADVVDVMGPADALLADGGATGNDVLMQIQADLTGVPVLRARTANLSALGAAFLAGGFTPPISYDEFRPQPGDSAAQRSAWRAAVARARTPQHGS